MNSYSLTTTNQYGGFYILKGESSELTTYDEDGYVIEERISVKRPKQLRLDEISLTVGYLAPDPREIPISRRTNYLNDTPNYRHFLVDAVTLNADRFQIGNRALLKRTGLF